MLSAQVTFLFAINIWSAQAARSMHDGGSGKNDQYDDHLRNDYDQLESAPTFVRKLTSPTRQQASSEGRSVQYYGHLEHEHDQVRSAPILLQTMSLEPQAPSDAAVSDQRPVGPPMLGRTISRTLPVKQPPDVDPREVWETSMQAAVGVHCLEVGSAKNMDPVDLVVFDFDETLTLITLFPEDQEELMILVKQKIGVNFNASESVAAANFESPFIRDRLELLKGLLQDLKEDGKILAVLTYQVFGVVAVLNLLMWAHLDEFFDAIWNLSPRVAQQGVFKSASGWQVFEPPVSRLQPPAESPLHEWRIPKPDVLYDLRDHPDQWFPQLLEAGADMPTLRALRALTPLSFVLVDDDANNFGSGSKQVLRQVLVTTFETAPDEDYKGQKGLRSKMIGGIGARKADDFKKIFDFVQAPWESTERRRIMMASSKSLLDSNLVRA